MISVVILTKNEEDRIKDCISSVLWCDEIILVDDYSKDSTIIKAEEYIQSVQGRKPIIKVFKHHLEADFSAQRNFGLEKATSKWVLFLDADERISHGLKEEILHKLNDVTNKIDGYFFHREDHLRGKALRFGEAASVVFLRLGRKKKGIWSGKVHETWEIKGEAELLKHTILHFPHPTIEEFLRDINWYTDLICKEWEKEGKKVRGIDLLIYPFAKFLYNYIFLFGFLDGNAGIIMAVMMSFHSFLVRGKYLTRKKSYYA